MLTFKSGSILQQIASTEKNWTVQELLESPDPLAGEPLADRNEAMRQVIDMAMNDFADLSESARLRFDFWQQLLPGRIENQTFEYTTKVAGTYRWQLTVNSEGLFYKDLSGEYSAQPGAVCEQLFSHFWFYGPLLPLPDLHTRKMVVAKIRNAFMQAGSSSSYQHFKLFEYPKQPVQPKQWKDGNQQAYDYVIVRDYGIEIGGWNWRDQLTGLVFVSFENFLHLPTPPHAMLKGEIRSEIEQMLAVKIQVEEAAQSRPAEPVSQSFSRDEPFDASYFPVDKNESKRLFMENAGQVYQIHRDGFGDRYHATPAEENQWRRELIEQYDRRIREEDNGVVLAQIARNMQANYVRDVEDRLVEAATHASPLARLGIAEALFEVFNSERAAEMLISLLDLQAEGDYWRNLVFNAFTRMRDNRGVQNFLAGCLRGSDEIRYKKSRDVLIFWGLNLGEQALADREFLKKLDWENAVAKQPDFEAALHKAIRIIQKD